MSRWILFGCLISMILVGTAEAQNLYVYPSKGQSAEQQQKDEWECHQWATKQTGVDPKQVAQEATSGDTYTQRPSFGGAVAGSAARGAALGAIGGAIAGNAGKGAAIGAGVAGAAGLLRARRETADQQTYNQNLEKYHQGQLNQYDQAFKACIQGRGYTVN